MPDHRLIVVLSDIVVVLVHFGRRTLPAAAAGPSRFFISHIVIYSPVAARALLLLCLKKRHIGIIEIVLNSIVYSRSSLQVLANDRLADLKSRVAKEITLSSHPIGC